MEKSRRVHRVEKEIREAIASHFVGSMRTELTGIVTVSHVFMSGDLRNARVYLSIFGSDDEVAESFEVIQEHASEIQHTINRRIKMKFSPKLKFYLDEGFEQMAQVNETLHGLGFGGDSESEEDAPDE